MEEWQQDQRALPPAQEQRIQKTPAEHKRPKTPVLTDAQQASVSARKLYLQLPREQLEHAMAVLALHPGSVPVYVHIPAEKATLLAPRINWCDASEDCLRRLNAAYGAPNVKLVEKA